MAKFSSIVKGKRARKRISLALGERAVDLDVRVLGPDEDIDIAESATRYAKGKGVDAPVPGGEIYDQAERAFTLLFACVDCDSPESAPARFFESVEEILTSPDLTRDHIAFLVEEQARWQDECSPRKREMSLTEYIQAVAKIAGGDIAPFARMSHGTQWTFTQRLASQLLSSQMPKSPSSSTSEATPSP